MSPEASQLVSLTPLDHRNLRTLTTRFDTRGGVIFITVVGSEIAHRFGGALRSFIGTLLWDFVQLNITLVLVWIGVQLGLRPVKRLRNEIAERSPNDLRPIVESSVPREIAPVVVTLNRLFATLRTSVQSQQQFIANTAHQLRTPDHRHAGTAGFIGSRTRCQNPCSADRLTTLQEGIRQLAHAANQLLTLARADPTANLTTKNEPLDVSALIGEVVAKFFDRALQLNIDLGVELQPATLVADPSLLDDLLNNLVDNALKYTPPGGRVTVSVTTQHGRVALAVEDSGPGIPEAERQRVRQRFYRLPNSPRPRQRPGIGPSSRRSLIYTELAWRSNRAPRAAAPRLLFNSLKGGSRSASRFDIPAGDFLRTASHLRRRPTHRKFRARLLPYPGRHENDDKQTRVGGIHAV